MLMEEQDQLGAMFLAQDSMARNFAPLDTLRTGEDETAQQDWTFKYLTCAAEEIFEAIREIPRRKFWSQKRNSPVNKQKLLEELADVMHFLVATALIQGWTAKDFHDAYMKKFETNKQRVADGY